MAANHGRGRPAPFWVLFVVLALLRCSSAQFCSFWDNTCIDPLAQSAVRLEFSPLFPDPITLYYGFDASSSGKGEGPMTKTAFWLRYNDHRVNSDPIDGNRTSEIALRVGNLTGTPSGTNNGCDGIWGTECSASIKSALQTYMYRLALSEEYYSKPLEYALNQLMRQSHGLSCGAPVLDVASIPVQEFAREHTADHNMTVMRPGSTSEPWQVWYLEKMTARQQASQVAVGIISRGPTYNNPPPRRPEDIQVELVCLQAPNNPLGSSSKSSH